jgi:hypothetical protein
MQEKEAGRTGSVQDTKDEQRVWYFAYGSNMSPITLRRRRLQYYNPPMSTKVDK